MRRVFPIVSTVALLLAFVRSVRQGTPFRVVGVSHLTDSSKVRVRVTALNVIRNQVYACNARQTVFEARMTHRLVRCVTLLSVQLEMQLFV